MSKNVYYYPENVGLTVVGHLEEDNMDYMFHILGVWKDDEGNMYWEVDSGCSCPQPFEDSFFNGADDHNLETDLNDLLDTIQGFPCHEDEKLQLLGWMGLGLGMEAK